MNSGVDDGRLLADLQKQYNLEIASGLGDWEGKILRIGCMGYSARPQNVQFVLSSLESALAKQGYEA